MSAMGIQINLDRVSTLPDAPKILVIKNKSEQSIDPEKSYITPAVLEVWARFQQNHSNYQY